MQFFRGTLPKHLLDGRDIDKANDYNRSPLGTGPYRVAEWKTGEYVLLERVPDYWRGAEYPQIHRLLFRSSRTRRRASTSSRAGEVHVVALGAVGQGPRAARDAVDRRSTRCSATATST